MTARRLALALATLGLAWVVWPDSALAWTPGTHVFLSETILANLRYLPAPVGDLLQAFPYDFLYGSIAPDTSIAKKYVPPGRHSHFWNIGQEVLEQAESDALRAFGYGYLTHLAADTIAHNYFIPRQLVLTSSTRSMGHSYWESRVETHLTDLFSRKARELILLDQSAADQHLERIISPTLFSVRTNRKIFRGIVHLAHTRSWHRAMLTARDRSRWLLSDQDVERHLGLAYDFIMEMLTQSAHGLARGRALSLDPSGAHALRVAKRLRKKTLVDGRLGSPKRLLEMAEASFGVRSLDLGFWAQSLVQRPWLTLPPQAPAFAMEPAGDA